MGCIMSKVRITDRGCWEYGGAGHARTGHGIAGYTVPGRTTTFYVHRWVYERTGKPMPDGMVLDHLCRNPPCCNPGASSRSHWARTRCRGDGPYRGERPQNSLQARPPAFCGDNLRILKGKSGPQRQYRECANMTTMRRAGEIRADK